MKKTKKSIKLLMVAATLIIAATLVSAGLLTYFGKMTVTADVKQSVVWDGDGDWHGWDDPIEWKTEVIGGCQFCDKTKIWNRGCVEGELDLLVDVWGPGGPAGVTVNNWILPGDLTLILENKDDNWDPIDDEYIIELTYNPCCPDFVWSMEGKVTQVDTKYVLIYYADQPDRFVVWGGAPAMALAYVKSDANGGISASGTADLLGQSFPIEDDWNIGPDADYHTSDGYCHAKGAKIWLIPVADFDGCDKILKGWNPADYMFETDLVVYFDCDFQPVPWIAKAYFLNDWCGPTVFPYIIGPNEKICLVYHYEFDWAIQPGVYTIQTKLVPV